MLIIDKIQPQEIKYAQTNATAIVDSAITSTVINVGFVHHLTQVDIRIVISQGNLYDTRNYLLLH